MAQQITLTAKQITLLKAARDSSASAATEAQKLVADANAKQQALNNLIIMFCEFHNIADPSKVTFDLDKGTATELEPADTVSGD